MFAIYIKVSVAKCKNPSQTALSLLSVAFTLELYLQKELPAVAVTTAAAKASAAATTKLKPQTLIFSMCIQLYTL